MMEIESSKRLSSLNGARIGLLDPGKRDTGVLLHEIGNRLEADFGADVAETWKKPSAYRVGSKKLIEAIVERCDGLVMGVVD